MTHVYSMGSFLGYPGSKELAEEAIKGLRGKLCYAHAFVILAATSGMLADIPGSKELLDDALAIYDRVLSLASKNEWRIPEHYHSAWNTDGQPGLVYTTDWEGKPIVRDKMHRTLAEAVSASAVLYHVIGKEKFANDYAEFW